MSTPARPRGPSPARGQPHSLTAARLSRPRARLSGRRRGRRRLPRGAGCLGSLAVPGGGGGPSPLPCVAPAGRWRGGGRWPGRRS